MFYNPTSGRFKNRRIEKMHAVFAEKFGNCMLISDPEKLKKIRNSHIIVVGGDGTLHVAFNSADLESNTFSCIAMGSGNDFVTGFPKRGTEVLCFRIAEDNWEYVDLIQADGIYSHTVCGVGFEALVSKKAQEKKPLIASLKYIIPVVKYMFTFKPVTLEVASDEFQYSGNAFMFSMGNGKRAGGGFKLFPKAKLTDGKMDMLLIEPPTFLQKLMYVWLVNFGKHANLKIVSYTQAKSCTVRLAQTGLFNADGDVYEKKEIHVQVVPNLLRVIQ